MSDVLHISWYDDVYMRVRCDSGTAMELSEYFTFTVPNAKFMPAFKNKLWDGKIRLYNSVAQLLYCGLRYYVEQFAKERSYDIVYDNPDRFSQAEFSSDDALDYIERCHKLPFAPHDYQLATFVHAIRHKRSLLVSPTASGKSLMIFLTASYLTEKAKSALVIVPTTSLVHQMASDFISYGGTEDDITKIFAGQEKNSVRRFVVTTWQSIYKLPKSWFKQFEVVIGDEAHLFQSKSLSGIMAKLDQCSYKYGFTGTLDGTLTHKLVLEGLFGPVKKVVTTSELINQKHLSAFRIKSIVLRYPADTRASMVKKSYPDEVDFILNHESRGRFITKLVKSMEGNTLVLFKIRDHGSRIFDTIQKMCPDRKVYYVDGDVDGLVREQYRHAVESETDSIIVASLGTFSTGINIKNLHNVVFASPSKSRVKTLQSIGRALRKSQLKQEAVLYDIADDLSWKSHKNHTLLHFAERMKMYNEEKFEYKLYPIDLKE